MAGYFASGLKLLSMCDVLSGEWWAVKISLHQHTNTAHHQHITQFCEDFDARALGTIF